MKILCRKQKWLAIICMATLCFAVLPGCGKQEETGELIVFAAASMTETLTELGQRYEADHPGVKVVFNFDSSGTLKTQIEEGAVCDLFISAGQKQMNQLDINASKENNPDSLDYVLPESRMDLLENKVVLCVPRDVESKVSSFDDLAQKMQTEDLLMAMGNEDVPVGQYTKKILEYYGLQEEALAYAGKITYGSNVKEVTTQITRASVDCGIVYCTDAYSAGFDPVDYATPDMCGQVIYPAAVMKQSGKQELAKDFLQYLTTEESMKVFEKVGFTGVDERKS